MFSKVFHDMSPTTEVFICLIALCAIYLHLKYSPSIAHKAPAFLTTFGILGTFIGIAFGLLDFNTGDIQKSVPDLIEGIKTAFWASAWGILCALTIKARDIAFDGRKRISEKVSTGATINDLASLLKAVQQALVGNDEATLIGQIRLARQDSNDRIDKLSRAAEEAHRDNNSRLDALTRSLDEFGKTVAENNSRALIDALKDVIHEFNDKISAQFGDNFKQLNEAIGQLLVWQERYRQQMSEMIEQQQITSQNMTTATEGYQRLIEHAKAFDAVANSMGALIEGLDSQRRQLDGSLSSLATLINSAAKGFPEIERKITEMVQQVSNGARTVNAEFNSHIDQMVQRMREQTVTLDTALQHQLATSLESLGRQLAALSARFVNDYTPLTERLRDVLEIAPR
jgi:ABC-type transporter Mla subunit MlaD